MAGVYGKITPKGYSQTVAIDASSPLASVIPPGSALAFVKVAAQAARWRDDGVPPTATVGFPLAVGELLVYQGNLSAFRIISSVAGSELNVSFYGV